MEAPKNLTFFEFLKSYITKKNLIIASIFIVLFILSRFFMIFGFVLVIMFVALAFVFFNKVKNEDEDLLKYEENEKLRALEEQLDEINKKIIYIKQKEDSKSKKLNKWIQPEYKREYEYLTQDDLKDLQTQRMFLLKKIENKRKSLLKKMDIKKEK